MHRNLFFTFAIAEGFAWTIVWNDIWSFFRVFLHFDYCNSLLVDLPKKKVLIGCTMYKAAYPVRFCQTMYSFKSAL